MHLPDAPGPTPGADGEPTMSAYEARIYPLPVTGYHKTCSLCGVSKAPAEFHRSAGSADGLHGYCRPCASKAHRARYAKRTRKGGAR